MEDIILVIREYEKQCKEHGLTEKETKLFIRALHHLGLVFYFHEDNEMKNTIFLKPDILLNSLGNSLSINALKDSEIKLHDRLNEISEEYQLLNKTKEKFDIKADRRANFLLWLSFLYLGLQFGLLARMVWWEFNWDIMEPITYNVTFGTFLGGYAFFVFSGKNYTYDNLKLLFKQRRLRVLYLRYGFNWRRWNELHNEVTLIQSILKQKK